MTERRVVFLGTPNAGKSTLFNRLTGAQAHVGNYPGITVEEYQATLRLPQGDALAVDLPGTYSLAARSPEERIAIDALLGRRRPRPDVVVIVVDTPRLARSLYLALQVLELELPVVMALNLVDEARRLGVEPDVEALRRDLGVPVVPVVARDGEGVEALRTEIARALDRPVRSTSPAGWSPGALTAIEGLRARLPAGEGTEGQQRAFAAWLLLSVDPADPSADPDDPGAAVAAQIAASQAGGGDVVAELIAHRYRWIDAREPGWLRPAQSGRPDPSEIIDRWLLSPWVGVPVFLVVMAVVFTALFSWADPMMGAIEAGIGLVGDAVAWAFVGLAARLPAPASPWVALLGDLTVQGVIGGVGAVVVFVPQIALLSLFLAILEDSGYLARAAFLMDRVLRWAGLPGQAFVPLLSGYACAVPAIHATRTLPRFRDRLLTMLVLPLTSCSARLPVYTLLIGALFPAVVPGTLIPAQPLALLGMYLFSAALTLLAAVVLGRTIVRDRATPTVLELPPWRWPMPAQVARAAWRRTRGFLEEATGTILVATVFLWALLTFPRYPVEQLVPEAEVAALRAEGVDPELVAASRALEASAGGQLGRWMEPVIRPLGFDWRIGVGLLGSFAAREVFVSTMGVVQQVGADEGSEDALRDRLRDARDAEGRPVYTPLVGASLMVFFAIALQCTSTLAVLRRESGGWRWPAFAFTSATALAWCASFVVYQGGALLGFQ